MSFEPTLRLSFPVDSLRYFDEYVFVYVGVATGITPFAIDEADYSELPIDNGMNVLPLCCWLRHECGMNQIPNLSQTQEVTRASDESVGTVGTVGIYPFTIDT